MMFRYTDDDDEADGEDAVALTSCTHDEDFDDVDDDDVTSFVPKAGGAIVVIAT